MRIHPATAWRKCIRPAWVLLFVAFVSFLPLLMQAKEAVDTFSRLTPRHIFSSTASVGVRFVTAWKVAFDDKSSYADPNTSDSSWTLAGTTLLNPDSTQTQQWKGIGWFRLWLDVDSALVGHQVGMSFSKHRGASEIFLNGKRLYTLGVSLRTVHQSVCISRWSFIRLSLQSRVGIALRYAMRIILRHGSTVTTSTRVLRLSGRILTFKTMTISLAKCAARSIEFCLPPCR